MDVAINRSSCCRCTPVVLINGKIAGNRKRTFVKNEVRVDVE
jgi:hypothetical protein